MTEQMMQEIIDDWQSWKYDIIELNNSTWTQRDERKLELIGSILAEQLTLFKNESNKVSKYKEKRYQVYHINIMGSYPLIYKLLEDRGLSYEGWRKIYQELFK